MDDREHRDASGNPRGLSGSGSAGGGGLSARLVSLWPGPVLIYGPDRRLISASSAECPLTSSADTEPDILALVSIVQAHGTSCFGSVQIDTPNGFHVYDLAALPGDGATVLVLARAVTLNQGLRVALATGRQRYKDLVEISSDFAWETGIDGRLVFVSPRGALGYPAASLIGRSMADFVLDPEADFPFVTRSSVANVVIWMRRADGGRACVNVSARPVFDDDGQWGGARGICRDITCEQERDEQQERARQREQIFNHIVSTFRDEVIPANVLHVAAETMARGMGAVSCHIFRRAPSSLLPSAGGDAETDPVRILREAMIPGASFGVADEILARMMLERIATGARVYQEQIEGYDALASVCRYHKRINGAVVLFRDQSHDSWREDDRVLLADLADQIGVANEQIDAHENILRLSRTDSLTGLFNRRAFMEEMERRHNRLARDNLSAALLFADLDNFKKVNDVYGHAAGDAALLTVRDMLVGSTRPTDLVARLGGDEFAIWLEGATQKVAVDKAHLLMEMSARELVPLSGSPDFPLGLSVGIAVHLPGGVETLADLMVRADHAMYKVKHAGKGGYAVADQTLSAGPTMRRPRG
ncbi:diguanylate cyclase [Haematospirillum jordaniae]|uniref:sensor domain-containing diguanylate cyclase n=1 Tax=Haematospirillum jordaniae TaxID=1549855 RepID=UPI001432877A|nr:diguanylate cyclase [Haematospirillum jordaniae]NKD85407.1 diguanylate cyclase [Haematospirillum jordaniae]